MPSYVLFSVMSEMRDALICANLPKSVGTVLVVNIPVLVALVSVNVYYIQLSRLYLNTPRVTINETECNMYLLLIHIYNSHNLHLYVNMVKLQHFSMPTFRWEVVVHSPA